MRNWTLLIILSFSCNISFGQEFYENKQFGIKMSKMTGWILATNEDLENSLKKLEFDEEQLVKLLNSNKGIISLCTYYKYKIDSVSGLIPTIKITVRSNPTINYPDFKQTMIESTNRVKTVVKNFEFIDNIKDIKVSDYPSLYYSCRYSMSLNDGGNINVRTKYYMIPKEKYFISISLLDNETNEDCSKIYSQLISSLQLKK